MIEAAYYNSLEDGKVQCDLCPVRCRLKPGKSGSCLVRKNIDGRLYAVAYGKVTALNIDPIEKKPLYHFYPGRPILSVGSSGCNLHCLFCQNCEISQNPPDRFQFQSVTAEQLSKKASGVEDNIGIAYTYNEPIIWYEFVRDTAQLVHQLGMKNVLVSNGYINPEPMKQLAPLIDAANIDLKSFSDDFYRKYTGSRLAPVLETLRILKDSGVYTEITHLVIPELNDRPEEFSNMCRWIAKELGKNTVLHISRYFPSWKMSTPPTPLETLEHFWDLAREHLDFVYLGNTSLPKGRDTFCPGCGRKVILRSGYYTEVTGISEHGDCIHCGHHILDHI